MDSDPNQSITYLVNSEPSFVSSSIDTSNTLTITGNATNPIDITTHSLVVNCTDGYDSAQDILTIVINENYAPTAPSVPAIV